jgi:Heme exporter protein D (CcmD)
MTHAAFVIAAFAVTALGCLWLALSSWVAMRRSEALADDLRKTK